MLSREGGRIKTVTLASVGFRRVRRMGTGWAGMRRQCLLLREGLFWSNHCITSTVSYGAPVLIPPGIGGFDF